MDRQIKFRGKELGSNEWVYGYYVGSFDSCGYDFHCIWFEDPNCDTGSDWVEVDKNTVGQFTGLKDKNGKEIYEGDIVDDGFSHNKDMEPVNFGYWEAGFGCLRGCVTANGKVLTTPRKDTKKVQYVQIIGNVHETKKL